MRARRTGLNLLMKSGSAKWRKRAVGTEFGRHLLYLSTPTRSIVIGFVETDLILLHLKIQGK